MRREQPGAILDRHKSGRAAEGGPAQPHPRGGPLKRWIVVGVVALAAAAGVWWKSRAKGEAPRYRTATVERGSIRSVVSATGTIQPVVQVQVGSQVSGTVSKLFADFNDRVKQGEVLCQLEPAAFRAREAQAEAAVAHAEAALEEAQRQLKRTNELVKGNYVSQADVEAAQVEVDQRAADLKQARAQLQAAAVDLANTTIRAPIDGVVIARTIDIGQTVAASLQAPQLFVIANDLAQMQVETKIDEADIGRIRAGLPVTFTVDAYPDAEFQGSVTQMRLQPIVESGVVTYTTVIRTQNRELKLRPGMTANVSVMVAIKDVVLKGPRRGRTARNAERLAGLGRGTRCDGGVRDAGGDHGRPPAPQARRDLRAPRRQARADPVDDGHRRWSLVRGRERPAQSRRCRDRRARAPHRAEPQSPAAARNGRADLPRAGRRPRPMSPSELLRVGVQALSR